MSDAPVPGYRPFDREIVNEAISIWRSDKRSERLKTKDLYRVILKNKPSWRPREADQTTETAAEETFPPFTVERLQKCLEDVSLAPEQLETPAYADKIKSVFPVPHLEMPTTSSTWVEVRQISGSDKGSSTDGDEKYKGKGIFAKVDIPKGKSVWTEQPLFRIPHVSRIRLMRDGLACAHCGHRFPTPPTPTTVPRGTVTCSICPARFCSAKCKNADLPVHAATWHTGAKGNKTSQIKPKAWTAYEEYCYSGTTTKGVAPSGAISGGNDPATDGSNQWMSGYAVGLALLKIITEVQKSAKKGRIIKEQFEAMATIPQDVRQKIADKTDTNNKTGSLFASEQAQLVWEKGYDLLKKAVSKAVTISEDNEETKQGDSPTLCLSYQWYLNAIGTWNLNNIGGCVFLLQSNLNHSCEPNVHIDFPSAPPATSTTPGNSYLLNPISVVAAKEIKQDEELTISYVNPEWSYDKRQFELKTNWGFACACPKCEKEAKVLSFTVDDDGNIING